MVVADPWIASIAWFIAGIAAEPAAAAARVWPDSGLACVAASVRSGEPSAMLAAIASRPRVIDRTIHPVVKTVNPRTSAVVNASPTNAWRASVLMASALRTSSAARRSAASLIRLTRAVQASNHSPAPTMGHFSSTRWPAKKRQQRPAATARAPV
jgi:hypothetical protein